MLTWGGYRPWCPRTLPRLCRSEAHVRTEITSFDETVKIDGQSYACYKVQQCTLNDAGDATMKNDLFNCPYAPNVTLKSVNCTVLSREMQVTGFASCGGK